MTNLFKNPSTLKYVILRGMNPVDKEIELKFSNLVDKIKYNGNLVYTDDDIIRQYRGGFENCKTDSCFLMRAMKAAINEANHVLVLNSDDNCTNLSGYEKELITDALKTNYIPVLFMDSIPFNADSPNQSYCTTFPYDIYGTLFYKAYCTTSPRITIVANEHMLEYYKVMFGNNYRDSYINMCSDIDDVKYAQCDWLFVFNDTSFPINSKYEDVIHNQVSKGTTVFYRGIHRWGFPFETRKYCETVFMPDPEYKGMIRKDLYFSQLLLKEKE